jgi:hypothetical protein
MEEKEDMVMRRALLFFILWGSFVVNPTFAMERHIMEPRVPPDKIEEARSLASPLPDTSDIVEKGKAIYEGKGTCFNCHGKTGRGDGPGGVSLNPSPRNFRHHGMWRHRTEGEIFWVIKHGSWDDIGEGAPGVVEATEVVMGWTALIIEMVTRMCVAKNRNEYRMLLSPD